MESFDRGESWHQGPPIASDSTGEYSYEYPAVFTTPEDDNLAAIVTAALDDRGSIRHSTS